MRLSWQNKTFGPNALLCLPCFCFPVQETDNEQPGLWIKTNEKHTLSMDWRNPKPLFWNCDPIIVEQLWLGKISLTVSGCLNIYNCDTLHLCNLKVVVCSFDILKPKVQQLKGTERSGRTNQISECFVHHSTDNVHLYWRVSTDKMGCYVATHPDKCPTAHHKICMPPLVIIKWLMEDSCSHQSQLYRRYQTSHCTVKPTMTAAHNITTLMFSLFCSRLCLVWQSSASEPPTGGVHRDSCPGCLVMRGPVGPLTFKYSVWIGSQNTYS